MDIVINREISSAPERATIIPAHGNFYHNILASLGYPSDMPPVADLLRQYHQLEAGEWVVASPIHWQATHNDAMIMASGQELQLSQNESQDWFTAFKDFVAPENMDLHYHDTTTWLLRYKNKPYLAAKPLYPLQNQSMMPALEKLDKTFFWQRFLTECQMFFSGHALNKLGKNKNIYPINGVWLWGHGKLNDKLTKQIYCCDLKLKELATLLSTSVSGDEFTKNSLLLFTALNDQARFSLEKQLPRTSICWYWNNIAYQSKSPSWISRFRWKGA